MTDTIFMNPSLLGFQEIQAFSGTFDWLTNPLTPAGTTNHLFNGSVVDGKNQWFEAGVAFTRRPDIDLIHLAVAKKVNPWLSLGASGKRFSSGSANPQSPGSATGIDFGISASVVLPQNTLPFDLQFGVISDNLIHTANNEQFIGPRQYGGGFKAAFNKILILYGDIVDNQSNFSGSVAQFSGAAEINVGSDFFIRGGLLGFQRSGWSYGAGWVGPKVALNYGFQTSHVIAQRYIDHVVTLDIFM